MAYKFQVGQKSVAAIIDEINKLGYAQDLSDNLNASQSGTSLDQNGQLSQTDPGLQTFTATSRMEIDSESLAAIQGLIAKHNLGGQSALLKRVSRADPARCVPPFDCGDTILT